MITGITQHLAFFSKGMVDALVWVLWLRVFITAGLALAAAYAAKHSRGSDKTLNIMLSVAFFACTWSAVARVSARMGAVFHGTGALIDADLLLPSEMAAVAGLGAALIYVMIRTVKRSECEKLGCATHNRRESDHQ